MSFKVSYISSAANHSANIAHWGRNNLICYGSCNAVLIYDLTVGSGKVVDTLYGHSKEVRAVRWITGCEHETELVSVSGDCNVIVWSLKDKTYKPTVLKGHTCVVNVVDALYKRSTKNHAVILSGSADSRVKVWGRTDVNGEFTLQQDVDLGYSICVGLRLVLLPNCDKILMACSMENSRIGLFVEEDGGLEKKSELLGHEDWVRGLDFTINGNDILLATSSQDTSIRIWKFTPDENYKVTDQNKYMQTQDLLTSAGKYVVTVETILLGHEGWIYSTHWSGGGKRLLSSSMDKTLIIWEVDSTADLWMESERLGEIGGNTLGFYGGMFSPDGKSIMAHGYHGAFHIWRLNEEINRWEPQVTVGGHFGEVVDLGWDPLGDYVMSVSYDQTTRIHGPWKKNNDSEMTWHEIARPQVHGYDLSSLAIVNRYKFASGAEEKIVRTFQAPDNFVQNFKRICNVTEDDIKYDGPKGASVPSLGLSNKAIYENDNAEKATAKSKKDPYPEESHFTAMHMTEPPTEETLLQNTLWPELRKLYGHGYEVYTMAASPDGKFIASACKATTPEHAALIIWDAENWQITQKLRSHTLTVVQIAFSPDSNHILSVSRDRRWSIFTKSLDTNLYELTATTNKSTGIHTRIIWCCAWSHDSKYFTTGSRDGKVVVWWRNPDKPKENILGQYEAASTVLALKNESITALAFAEQNVAGNYLLAVGLEKGFIQLYKWSINGFKEALVLDNRFAHHLTVKRLSFRPVCGRTGYKNDDKNILQLASCSSDHSLRIYDIDVTKI